MHSNLKAEMARKRLRVIDIANCIGKTEKTAGNKISGKCAFTMTECAAIKNAYFPDLSIEYLFATEG